MFVGEQMRLDISFAVARARLARLGQRGALLGPSEDAYGQGTASLARVGIGGVAKLVRVQVRELARTDQAAGLALRWEATGAGGRLFPVMDADLKLTPDGDHGTWLTMASAYRPPLGAAGETVDRAVLHRVATATVRSFVTKVAAELAARPGPIGNGAGSSPSPPGMKT